MPGAIQTRFCVEDGIVLEEADESAFWIELLIDPGKATSPNPNALLCEANGLVAICISSINTARTAK
jgi:hypothetical protein